MPAFLVTDVDDTIKITYVEDYGYVVYNGLFGTQAFAGMSTLYQNIPTANGLVALSGAPELTNKRLSKFLKKNNFDASKVILKPSIFDNTENHKVNWLIKLAANSTGKFILVGDDTEHDPEAYQRFFKAYPDRVMAMYIRVVKGRKIPNSMIRFHTALDIAQAEYLYRRLDAKSFLDVATDLLSADESRFMPEYAACQSAYIPEKILSLVFDDSQMRLARENVDARMKALCKKRYSNPNWIRFYGRTAKAN